MTERSDGVLRYGPGTAAPAFHQAHRGDEIDEWLKSWRESFQLHSAEWLAADDLLEDYRLHADCGAPLSAHVISRP